jgi:hypothetical protein
MTISLPRLALRHVWLIPGLALSFLASAQAAQHGLGIAPLLAFGILPHVPALAGPRGRAIFNAMHHPAPPVVLAGLAFAGVVAPLWLVAGLAWLSHVIVDRALGDGHRSADGARRGALA